MALMWRIYDITFSSSRQDLPSEIILDLNNFACPDVGMGNLNHKAYAAIKAITGCDATSCKVEPCNKI